MAGQTRGIVIGGHLPAEVQAAGGGQPLSRQRQKRNVAAGRQGLAVVIPDRIRQAMRQRLPGVQRAASLPGVQRRSALAHGTLLDSAGRQKVS